MDPNLFAIDGERLLEALLGIVVLSFILERALAVFFENRLLVDVLSRKGLKEFITILVALGVCRYWDFDALSIIFVKDKTQFWGHLVTASVVAGGSKASIKLFHDVLGVMSTAEEERRKRTKAHIDHEVAQIKAAP